MFSDIIPQDEWPFTACQRYLLPLLMGLFISWYEERESINIYWKFCSDYRVTVQFLCMATIGPNEFYKVVPIDRCYKMGVKKLDDLKVLYHYKKESNLSVKQPFQKKPKTFIFQDGILIMFW